tara:strand:+ start:8277 stop:9215 length:939 start_codon:yes stop_codon:yes gene_type:complete
MNTTSLSTPAIEVHGVTRNFGSVAALHDVSFSVPQNSIVGLLGRNGAGKTTIMSILSGQDRPSQGHVTVLGHAPFEHAPTLTRIINVRDNQRYPDDYRLHHVLRIAPDFAPHWNADVAAELVDAFQIPAKTALKKLSRGQLSSIAIVLGLASRAPITLLDEPYLGLDVAARALFHRVLLRDYGEHPRTVVLSTHLIDESASLFDRVLIMNKGRIVVDDETDNATARAFTVSGATRAVEAVLVNHPVLESHTIGALTAATAAGEVNEALREHAAERGVHIGQPTLQELASALGGENALAYTGNAVEKKEAKRA